MTGLRSGYGTMTGASVRGALGSNTTMTIAQRGRRTMTLDEFLALPEESPAFEYQDGVITQKMAPERDHGGLQYVFCRWINDVGQPGKLAVAFPEFRATYRDDQVSFVPDVSVYLWARIPRERGSDGGIYAFTPPDIAIEIASPGQSRRRLIERCRRFVELGSKAALLADPRRQDIVEVRPDGVERRLRGADVLDLGDIVPGLSIPVGDLFAALTFD
jgi:Uma2 family endonuclease